MNIVLFCSIIIQHMEDFKEQADGVRHISSNYSKEMATKSSVVSYNIRNGIHPNVYQITVSS